MRPLQCRFCAEIHNSRRNSPLAAILGDKAHSLQSADQTRGKIDECDLSFKKNEDSQVGASKTGQFPKICHPY